jgi:hypothetical protein
MSSSTTNIRIEPADVTWEIEEQWCVTAVADSSGSLDATYFTLSSSGNTAATHYVWIDVDNSSVDPAPAGLTGIEVDIATDDTAATIATAVQTAVDANGSFQATVSDSVNVIISNVGAGVSSGAEDGAAATGFIFAQQQDGGSTYLGLLDGDIEVSFEETLFELTAHQTGVSKIADLRQGVSAEVSLTIKESDAEIYKAMITAAGGSYTPSGGTELYGWGKSRQGSNTIIQARRLTLHPVRLADNVYTDDLCFWKAYPLPDSVTYSGENPRVLSVTFRCYLDTQQNDAIELFAFGDWTQEIPS